MFVCVVTVSIGAMTFADSCPRYQIDGVSASACQIGDDIQVLAHNYNAFPVSFTVKVTYRLKGGGARSRWIEGRLSADGGGQLADWRHPDRSLRDVTDVEVRNVVKR
jgi:hypothetical protein